MISKYKRLLLIDFVDSKCDICHKLKDNNNLEIHRINEGYKGGTYEDYKNLLVVCKVCHKKLHTNQFKNVKTK